MKIIYLLIFTFLTLSCRQAERYSYLTTIKDDSLKATIRKYVSTIPVDPKSHFVIVECFFSKEKSIFEISNGKSSHGYRSNPPDCFTLLDQHLVIFRLTDSETFQNGTIADEIDAVISEKNITLTSSSSFYDPPVWTLLKYGSEYRLIVKYDSILEYLPRDYYLMEDFSKDSLTLHKRDVTQPQLRFRRNKTKKSRLRDTTAQKTQGL